jgi:hypothetical protein
MCVVSKSNRTEVIEENGKTARFENLAGRTYEVGDVDKCLFKGSPEKKCDYFFRTSEKIWLIEFKGSDVAHAAKQIAESTGSLSDYIQQRHLVALIVASKCPAVAGQQKYLAGLKKCSGRQPDEVVLKSMKATIRID